MSEQTATDQTATPEGALDEANLALGEPGTEPHPGTLATRTVTVKPSDDVVEEALRDVVDPELGINVVDLGLVYGLQVSDDITVTVDMTLTSAACPLTDVIEEQINSALVGSGLTNGVAINWVWMPPWGPDKITDDGREQLRALGFNV